MRVFRFRLSETGCGTRAAHLDEAVPASHREHRSVRHGSTLLAASENCAHMFKRGRPSLGTMINMEIDQHIAALESDGCLLADAAGCAGLAAPVPSCPGWRVADLLRHIRYVHQWATAHVCETPAQIMAGPLETELLGGGPPDAELLEAYRAGHQALAEALRSADPALACVTFLPAPSPLAFWTRRQAHETAIHRADAELAASGPVTPFEPEFAADGIDELIVGFASRKKTGPATTRTLQLHATDTGDRWQVIIGLDGIRGHRGTGQGGTVLTGPASELYLLLWNRRAAGTAVVTIAGDPAGLHVWQDTVQVRWT
jgi:uncharacterized protein (TIGR03083 family)